MNKIMEIRHLFGFESLIDLIMGQPYIIKYKPRRGTTKQKNACLWIYPIGEFLLDTDTRELFISDGETKTCDLLPIAKIDEKIFNEWILK